VDWKIPAPVMGLKGAVSSYSGDCEPRELIHSYGWAITSVRRAFLSIASRVEPGGSRSGFLAKLPGLLDKALFGTSGTPKETPCRGARDARVSKHARGTSKGADRPQHTLYFVALIRYAMRSARSRASAMPA
jgi:hypothetical protein